MIRRQSQVQPRSRELKLSSAAHAAQTGWHGNEVTCRLSLVGWCDSHGDELTWMPAWTAISVIADDSLLHSAET